MYFRRFMFSLVLLSVAGCTTTEAEKDAQYSTPRIPLSDGTFFVQRVTPASTCRQKYQETQRVNKFMKQDGFIKRGKGEILVFDYQLKILTDLMENCRGFISKSRR